jgi:hypothetical protein
MATLPLYQWLFIEFDRWKDGSDIVEEQSLRLHRRR